MPSPTHYRYPSPCAFATATSSVSSICTGLTRVKRGTPRDTHPVPLATTLSTTLGKQAVAWAEAAVGGGWGGSRGVAGVVRGGLRGWEE